MATTPTKTMLRQWTDDQLWRVRDFIGAEFARREEVELAQLERVRRQKQKEEWEERARTVVRFRYIQQTVRCGKAACHCMRTDGSGHPGYWYRIDTYGDGRRRKRYIGKKRPKGAPQKRALGRSVARAPA